MKNCFKYFVVFVFCNIIVAYAKDIYATSLAYEDVSITVASASPGDVVNWEESSLMVPGGIYLLHVLINNGTLTKKIVIN